MLAFPIITKDTESTFLYFRIQIENTDRFRKELLFKGVDSKRDDMSACSNKSIFKEYNTPCPHAESLPSKSIEIPNNPLFNKNDINYIADQIKSVSAEMLQA